MRVIEHALLGQVKHRTDADRIICKILSFTNTMEKVDSKSKILILKLFTKEGHEAP